MKIAALLFLSALSLLQGSCARSPHLGDDIEHLPLVIGHRGASGHLPEHTIEAYLRAIEMGADYIEPDLVVTKDGVLIARHENELSDTTDVAEKFPERRVRKKIDGQTVQGWFAEDFTLAEIKTLRARQRLPFRDQSHNGLYAIPTFAEVLDLRESESHNRRRRIGVYPETKHPTYFRAIGLPIEERLVGTLKKYGLVERQSPVIIQSFETTNLKMLQSLLPVRRVQLIGAPEETPFDLKNSKYPQTYRQMMTPAGLQLIASYADGIGPHKAWLIVNGQDSGITRTAQKQGLLVHPYTFRDEPQFLAPHHLGQPAREYDEYLALGIDGFFTDFPDQGVLARQRLRLQKPAPAPTK